MPESPVPGKIITIDGKNYSFTAIENTPGLLYAEPGKKAKVYRLRDNNTEKFVALKVFHSAYRGGEHDKTIVRGVEKIAKYQNIPGLLVAKRSVVLPSKNPKLIGDYPDFSHAIKMEWVRGEIWQNIIGDKRPLSSSESNRLVVAFLSVLCELENQKLAHCDLSGANFVIVNYDRIELIDVEDMKAPNFDRPDPVLAGSPGYVPKNWAHNNGLWEESADRMAGAILLFEMLCWRFDDIRSASKQDSFFTKGEIGHDSKRYRLMHQRLNDIHPDLPALFEKVWTAQTTTACPKFSEWKTVIDQITGLVVAPLILDFGHVRRGSQPANTLELTNVGTGSVSGNVHSAVKWLRVSGGRFSLSAGQSHTCQVTLESAVCPSNSSGQPQDYPTSLLVKSNVIEKHISIKYLLKDDVHKPILDVQPERSLFFGTVTQRKPIANAVIKISNTGSGSLSGQIRSNYIWLRLSRTNFNIMKDEPAYIAITLTKDAPLTTGNQSKINAISITSNGGSATISVDYQKEKRKPFNKMILAYLAGIVMLAAIGFGAWNFYTNTNMSSNALTPGQNFFFTSTRDQKREIYFLDKQGDAIRITTTADDSESWDAFPVGLGSMYLTSTRSGKREIYFLDDQGDVNLITNTPGNGESWAPVPLGKGTIYYTSTRDGKREIYFLDENGDVHRVTTTPENGESWGPVPMDKGTLYFTSTRDGKREIYFLDENGENHRITNTPDKGESWGPVPLGKGRMYYTSTRDGKREIYYMDEMGDVHRVTTTPGQGESWGPYPSGSGSFYFTSTRDKKREIYFLDPEGNSIRITNSDQNLENWLWD
jgi:serine/threonine protein kinase